MWESTHRRLEQVGRKAKQFADSHRGETPQYNPDDHVWLSTKDLRSMKGSKKLNVRYIGLYKILECITKVTYKLDLSRYCRLSPTCLKFVISGS